MYQKQMSFFENGGLYDEGGMTDPVSGNDVPPGSTRAEVRDDIPAMLSEGEFVMPADVVRYFGLEKLMEMRQEAKLGLKKMEAMGQMGNSEEATLPDDLPFSPEDLIIMGPQEMAQGGVVKAQQGTYVQPSGFTGSSLNRPNFIPPSSARPVTTSGTPTGYLPSFVSQGVIVPTGQDEDITQGSGTTTTNYNLNNLNDGIGETDNFVPTIDEVYTYRKYKNTETGEVRDIPFYFDQPVVPIPDGFVPYSEEDTTETEDTTDTSVKTARVIDRESEWGGGEPGQQSSVPSAEDIANMTEAELNDLADDVNSLDNLALMGLANPVMGLIGRAISKDYKNRVAEPIDKRAKELGIPNPLGKSKTKNTIIDKIKSIFTQNKNKKEEEQKTKTKTTTTPTTKQAPTTTKDAPKSTPTDTDDEDVTPTFNFSDDDLAMAQSVLGNTQTAQDFKDDMMALAEAQNLSAEDIAMAQDVLGTPTPTSPSMDEAITGIDINEPGTLSGGKDVSQDVVDAVAAQAAISRAANVESKIGLDVFGPVSKDTTETAQAPSGDKGTTDTGPAEAAPSTGPAVSAASPESVSGAMSAAFSGFGTSKSGEFGGTPSVPGDEYGGYGGLAGDYSGGPTGPSGTFGGGNGSISGAASAEAMGFGSDPGGEFGGGNADGAGPSGGSSGGTGGGGADSGGAANGGGSSGGSSGGDAGTGSDNDGDGFGDMGGISGGFNKGGLAARKQKPAKRKPDTSRGVAARKKK